MKTPPILLKILHNSAAKPSPNFNKTASRKSDGGFTIIELLVIVLLQAGWHSSTDKEFAQ